MSTAAGPIHYTDRSRTLAVMGVVLLLVGLGWIALRHPCGADHGHRAAGSAGAGLVARTAANKCGCLIAPRNALYTAEHK